VFNHRNYIKDRRKETRVEVNKVLTNINNAAGSVVGKKKMLQKVDESLRPVLVQVIANKESTAKRRGYRTNATNLMKDINNEDMIQHIRLL
jgi:DNA-binding FrmR family transcriptional regulator